MAFDVKQLTRNELAMFLPNQRAISAFENLFNVPASVNANTQDIEDANLNSASAEAKAQVALDEVGAAKTTADNAQNTANQALAEVRLLSLAPPLVM
jgi:hypothetical protein